MAKLIDIESIASYFQSLGDPRYPKNRKHLLVDIIIICVAGVVSGCDGPTAIRRRATRHKERLAKYLQLPNGIPSRDCIRRVLLAIEPEAFQRCFAAWTTRISATRIDESAEPQKRPIAIDGKTCRGSRDDSRFLGPLHLVSAWASEEGLAPGQVAAEEKSNEITAIPLLLEQISLVDAIVTIDAMGCQKAIVERIVERGGDGAIAVKKTSRTCSRRSDRISRSIRTATSRTCGIAGSLLSNRATAAQTTVGISRRMCRRISDRRRTGRARKRSGTAYDTSRTTTVASLPKCAIIYRREVRVESDSRRRYEAIGESSRCIGYWT